MLENALLQALQEAITPSRVYTDHKTLSILARDALHPGRMPGWTVAEPLCVVRPEHTSEVAAVVRLANTHGVPVIPVGGGSGLMGGAASHCARSWCSICAGSRRSTSDQPIVWLT